MVVLIILAVIGFVLLIVAAEEEEIIMCGIGLVLIVPIALALIFYPPVHSVYEKTIPIYALKDEVSTSSRYYLYYDAKYFYLTDYKEGKKMYSLDKNDCYIVEEKEGKPRIEVLRENFVHPNWFYSLIYFKPSDREYRLIVPPGSVIDGEYKIDLE